MTHPSTVPCPACAEPMLLFRARTGKPYLVCRPCGVQVFIRNEVGVAKFAARHGEWWTAAPKVGDLPTTETAPAPASAPKAKENAAAPAGKGATRGALDFD